MSWEDGSRAWDASEAMKNQIIVGTDKKGHLHIKIFDKYGSSVTHMDGTTLPRTLADKVSTLKRKLLGFSSSGEPTNAEKEQVISQAVAIHQESHRHRYFRDDDDIIGERVKDCRVDVTPSPEHAYRERMDFYQKISE
jgi:hypothetical protein